MRFRGVVRTLGAAALVFSLAGCAGLGLPVPVGDDVAYDGLGSQKIAFNYPNDWEATGRSDLISGYPVVEFKFGKFPNYFVSPSVKSLWAATRCSLFVDATVGGVRSGSKAGRELLIRNLAGNIPKDATPRSGINYTDVSFDTEEYPHVMARVEGRYTIPIRETVSRNGIVVSRKEKPTPWHSFGQAIQSGDTEIYLICKGDVRYNNQFEALADSLAESMTLRGI